MAALERASRLSSLGASPVLCILYYCLCMLSVHAPCACSLSFNLSFSKPQSPDLSQLINCTGDAYLTPDTLELTRNRRDQSITDSVARATYTQPVPLWDTATGETASFTTTFSFRITPDTITFHGDGMAFFLGHFGQGIPINSTGSMLGLIPYHTNGTGDGTIVAVEFDTYRNRPNDDISSSHVGIDINSLNSTALIQSCCALGSTIVSCWLKRSFRDCHRTCGSISVIYSDFRSGSI